MKLLALVPLLGAALMFGGCGPVDPVTTSPTNNPNVQVEELLSHDGCTVYRFADSKSPLPTSVYHYYVHCRDKPAAAPAAGGATRPAPVTYDVTLGEVSCGKACTRTEEIPTVSR